MRKRCVFCGEQPESKTLEHVLPKWLIKHTGNPNRNILIGPIARGEEFEFCTFSFSSVKFPACNSCNQEFGNLESTVKPIILKILSREALSSTDLNVLLDWFDKVRIGLWLGFLNLNRNVVGINPCFHIKQRMGIHDRVLIICRSNLNKSRLSFCGANTFAFQYMPSCFSLGINDFWFINISYPFLIARRYGFPYPKVWKLVDRSSPQHGVFTHGLNRVLFPLLKKPFYLKCTELYQPMYQAWINQDGLSELYDNEYVRERCVDLEKGIGKIVVRKGKRYEVYPAIGSKDWYPTYEYPAEVLYKIMAKEVFKRQIYLYELWPSLEGLKAKDRIDLQRQKNRSIKFNKKMISQLQKSKITLDID